MSLFRPFLSKAASYSQHGSDTTLSHPISEENRMHLIRVPESQIHTYDRQMSVISEYNAQNVQERFINLLRSSIDSKV
jgi:hypothetical protein